MKIVDQVASRWDIHDYVAGLWMTDAFRDAHTRQGTFVHGVVDRFAALPRLFARETNDHLERAHFSTWWGVMMHRDDYTNPYVADLYWLHEFYHAGTMPYVPEIGRAAFDDKMQRNELEASVASEIQIYFEMPELRALSFDHDIYADRFLNNADMRVLWASNREIAIETIRARRRDVMVSKPEYLMDTTERWIRRFAEQNAVYGATWNDRYCEVERRMAQLQVDSVSGRLAALTDHRAWIEEEAARDQVHNIPFRREARVFSTYYWENKEAYSEAMLREEAQHESA